MISSSYEDEVRRTMRPLMPQLTPHEAALTNYALGLAGEAGEAADLLKKAIFHREDGAPLRIDEEKLKKEIGDVLWYASALAIEMGMDLGAVMEANVAKLRARYPGGFTGADAAARKDERP